MGPREGRVWGRKQKQKEAGMCGDEGSYEFLSAWRLGFFLKVSIPISHEWAAKILVFCCCWLFGVFFFFFFFGCAESSLLGQLFSSCDKQGPLSTCGAQASDCGGFSCCRAWALGHAGSVAEAFGLSCLVACGIFLDRGWNSSPLHWRVDS